MQTVLLLLVDKELNLKIVRLKNNRYIVVFLCDLRSSRVI